MHNRRKFLGFLGTLPAFGLAGKICQKKPLVEPEGTLWKTATFDDGVIHIKGGDSLSVTYKKPVKVLRLSHPVTYCVRKGHVKPGHWFTHVYGETDWVDLGKELILKNVSFLEHRAVRFGSMQPGFVPSEVYTDPNSEGYKKIVSDSYDSWDKNPLCMWGPVYKLTDIDNNKYQLFLGSKSLRKFASKLDNINNTYYQVLGTVKVTTSNRQWSWMTPSLRLCTYADIYKHAAGPMRNKIDEELIKRAKQFVKVG